jgi:glucose/arabinose dehydrogenase
MPPTPPGTGTGLLGQYYDNINFTDLKFTRTDPTLDFNWGRGAPASSMAADTFSVRWTGQVEARYSETYTFETTTDDGVRVWVNGQQIINRFVDQSATAVTGQIALQAGQKYDIRVEYYENGGDAVSRLAWSSASQTRQIIPTSQLYNTPAPQPGAGTLALQQNLYTVSERAGFVDVIVERTGGTTGAASIDYTTVDGTARAGSDYTRTAGTLQFTPGETFKVIRIPVLQDTLVEGDEAFSVALDRTVGASLGTIRTATVELADDDSSVVGNGTGLRGEYYDNINFTNLRLTRTDSTVNFDWGFGSPAASISPDTFSVRWTGQVQPRFNEEYTFYTTSDDGIRLTIDGQTVINRFVDQAPTTNTGRITLEAGRRYDIRLDYYENGGGAVSRLEWSSLSQARQIIPRSQLYVSPPGPQPSPTTIEFNQTAAIVDESAGTASIQLNRIGSTSGIASVSYATSNGTATAGSDYAARSGTVSFAAGETTKTITVPITNDTTPERNETFAVTLSNPVGATLGSKNRITQTINDDDVGSFALETVVTGLTQPTDFAWNPSQTRMYIAEKGGVVRVFENGQLAATPFIDISGEVNGARDRGLLSIAVHPDFPSQPYIYLLYTYDPPQTQGRTGLAAPDANGNRPSRLLRVTADASTNYRTAVPGSGVVILGKNSIWDYTSRPDGNSTDDLTIPPSGIIGATITAPASQVEPGTNNIRDYLATDSESHSIGDMAFGADGSLFVSNGDGTSYGRVDPRTVRVQDIDNLSGKLLRINPITGAGYANNPFANGDLNSNRSKVYDYGLRNPFRVAVQPGTNNPYIGDVGWTQWEEVNTGRGQNFGWPYFEGDENGSARTGGYQDLPAAQAFYNSGSPVTAPLFARSHVDDGARAIVLGDFYDGTTFPSVYNGALFVGDVNQGIVQALLFTPTGAVDTVKTFATGLPGIVQYSVGNDGSLYYTNIGGGPGTGVIGRWRPDSGSSGQRIALVEPPAYDFSFMLDAVD